MTISLGTCELDLRGRGERLRTAPRSAVGGLGEAIAAAHLTQDDGYTLLARNWRSGDHGLPGELDLVAADDDDRCLVVVEVKTRRGAERFGGARAAVAPVQQRRLRVLTRRYLAVGVVPYRQVRIDLIAIDVGRRVVLHHLRGVL